jgi:hypothetical protein
MEMTKARIKNKLVQLVEARDNHVWWALRDAKRKAQVQIWEAQTAVARLNTELEGETTKLVINQQIFDDVTAHAARLGWTLDPPPDVNP